MSIENVRDVSQFLTSLKHCKKDLEEERAAAAREEAKQKKAEQEKKRKEEKKAEKKNLNDIDGQLISHKLCGQYPLRSLLYFI